ncbi:MAG: hypothetical protein ACO3GO_05795, partial [Terrimicrobiaceae bacterium]
KLLDPMISEIPFAFHTKDEKHPWVKVVFPSKVRLSAMSIVNRRELYERAAGLVLQRLGPTGEWETIWTSDQPREVWNVDLTELDADKREGSEFRFYITSDAPTCLHLANIALWGQEIPAPAATPEPPKAKKKP